MTRCTRLSFGHHVKEYDTVWKQKSFCMTRVCVTRRVALGNAEEVVGRERTMKGLTYLPKELEFYPVVTEESLRGFAHGRI